MDAEKTETRIAALERQVEHLTRKLDEARRYAGLSPLIDDQLHFIHSRQATRGGNAA